MLANSLRSGRLGRAIITDGAVRAAGQAGHREGGVSLSLRELVVLVVTTDAVQGGGSGLGTR